MGPYRHHYDQRLVKAFVRLIQPFPVGSKIRLRDRRYGVVVKYNRDNPVAPYIVVAFDPRGERYYGEDVEGVLMLGRADGRMRCQLCRRRSFLHV